MTDQHKQPTQSTDEQPTRYMCPLTTESAQMVAELLPAVRGWAASEGVPRTEAGDVVALAIGLLHAQVLGRAYQMVTAADGADDAKNAADDAIRKALAMSPKH